MLSNFKKSSMFPFTLQLSQDLSSPLSGGGQGLADQCTGLKLPQFTLQYVLQVIPYLPSTGARSLAITYSKDI